MTRTRYAVFCHEMYKSGSPSSTGGCLKLLPTWELAEEFVQRCVDEDVSNLGKELGRELFPSEDFYDSMNPFQRDGADCYRHTDIGNSEVYYFIDPIEV